jgi:hypothetical protein
LIGLIQQRDDGALHFKILSNGIEKILEWLSSKGIDAKINEVIRRVAERNKGL